MKLPAQLGIGSGNMFGRDGRFSTSGRRGWGQVLGTGSGTAGGPAGRVKATKKAICWPFVKPSDGLEPSTPLSMKKGRGSSSGLPFPSQGGRRRGGGCRAGLISLSPPRRGGQG